MLVTGRADVLALRDSRSVIDLFLLSLFSFSRVGGFVWLPLLCPRDVAQAPAAVAADDDGPGVYDLVGFISHIGKNTGSGHYVCHIKKDGKWTLFNDSKVAFSEQPPFDMGYIYVFRRRT